jgi:hypothetical protein
MSDNTALVLVICCISMTVGGSLIAAIRGAVEIIRIIKGREPHHKTAVR